MNSTASLVVEAASRLPEASDGLRSKIVANFSGFPSYGKRRDPSPEIKIEFLIRGPNQVDAYPEKEVDPERLAYKQLSKLLPKGQAEGWKIVHASGERGIEEFGGYMWRRHVIIIGREASLNEGSDAEGGPEVRGSDLRNAD